jgi:asparagine synthase (glutamine-hydrolysing)
MSELTDSIETFSIGFEAIKDSELPYARIVAEKFGTTHHEFMVEDRHLELIPKMVWHLDEPIADAATLPTMVISEEAKKYVTVVLAGEGGDELFAGYDNQRVMMQVARASHFLHPGSPAISPAINLFKRLIPLDSNIYRLFDLLSLQEQSEQYFSLNALFNRKELLRMGLSEMKPDLSHCYPKGMVLLNSLLYYGFHTWLPNDFCMKADKMTMAYGIEERAPLLDHQLVDFSFTLPVSLKLRNGSGKYILKKAMQKILPREIIHRQKHGYNAPMDVWFKGPLKDSLEHILEERSHSFYDRTYVTTLLKKFQKTGSKYQMNFFNAQKLWSILMFETWYKIFIDESDVNRMT